MIQWTIFKKRVEIRCVAHKCNFSDIAGRAFRGVVLILVLRLSVKKGLMIQQAIALQVCSWGARGECRRGLSDDFNM